MLWRAAAPHGAAAPEPRGPPLPGGHPSMAEGTTHSHTHARNEPLGQPCIQTKQKPPFSISSNVSDSNSGGHYTQHRHGTDNATMQPGRTILPPHHTIPTQYHTKTILLIQTLYYYVLLFRWGALKEGRKLWNWCQMRTMLRTRMGTSVMIMTMTGKHWDSYYRISSLNSLGNKARYFKKI